MKRLVLLTFVAMLGGAALWRYAQMEPGYMVIHFAGYTVETGFVLGVVLLALVIVALYFIVYLISRLFGLKKYWRNRQDRRLGKKLQNGMLDFIEGRHKQAQTRFQKVAKNAVEPLVSLLLAARSAHRLGNDDDVAKLLDQADKAAPSESNAVALTQYELYRDRHDWERALATLNHLAEQDADLPMLLVYKAEVYRVLQDWASLEPLLESIKKHRLMNAERFENLERETYLGLLANTFDAVARHPENQSEALDRLGVIWAKVPKHLREDSAIKRDYCRDLIDLQEHDQAEKLIRKSLDKSWAPELVKLYGEVHSRHIAKQLTNAQKWLDKQGDSAILRLTLGRLCLSNELWGQAKEHFEAAVLLDTESPARLELARLLMNQGEFKLAAQHYHSVANDALPTLPQPKA